MLRRKLRMQGLRSQMIGDMCCSFREDGQGRPHLDTIWEKLPEEEKKKPCTYQMTEHTRQKALRVKMLRLEHACSDDWTSKTPLQLSEEKERRRGGQRGNASPDSAGAASHHLSDAGSLCSDKALAGSPDYCITEACGSRADSGSLVRKSVQHLCISNATL